MLLLLLCLAAVAQADLVLFTSDLKARWRRASPAALMRRSTPGASWAPATTRRSPASRAPRRSGAQAPRSRCCRTRSTWSSTSPRSTPRSRRVPRRRRATDARTRRKVYSTIDIQLGDNFAGFFNGQVPLAISDISTGLGADTDSVHWLAGFSLLGVLADNCDDFTDPAGTVRLWPLDYSCVRALAWTDARQRAVQPVVLRAVHLRVPRAPRARAPQARGEEAPC